MSRAKFVDKFGWLNGSVVEPSLFKNHEFFVARIFSRDKEVKHMLQGAQGSREEIQIFGPQIKS